MWTAAETLGLALGPGLFALMLALGGYRSSTDGSAVQPDSAITAIVLGFSLVPAALTLLSLFWLTRYSLGDPAHLGLAPDPLATLENEEAP